MLKQYFLRRLSEASTMRGIVNFVLGAIGYQASTTKTEAIVSVALAIVGLIGVFLADKMEKKDARVDTARTETTAPIGADVGP